MKILITGANGQLGSEIRLLAPDYSNYTFIFTDVDELDITNRQAVYERLMTDRPDVIINCAAYTAVDDAEDEPEKADLINHKAVEILSAEAKRFDIFLMHTSTDYVFDGTQYLPYKETDSEAPTGIYGQTKWRGEQAMQSILDNGLIIRTAWLYSEYGKNFVKTMLRLGQEKERLSVIFDQTGSPTYAKDLAQVILEILPNIKRDTFEIYHFSNEGVCSWFDFAKAIFELKDISCNVEPIESKDFPAKAPRPHYSVLNKAKIKQDFGVDIRHWREALYECLKNI